MLFNSYSFIFFFLPTALIGFYLLNRNGTTRRGLTWLVFASLFFYAWWNPVYLILMLGSIGFNYLIGRTLALSFESRGSASKPLLTLGIAANLGLLGYFKYANFFVSTVNAAFPTGIELPPIVLPLAISFFTFQQITYLVDAWSGDAHQHDFLHYCLYVTFFPQLIAGPIVRSSEILPQYTRASSSLFKPENLAVGLTLFFVGLFKKVILADGISVYSTPLFHAAEAGTVIPFFDAWLGAIAYTFQLYFDFSGYSDMAIGLAQMFGFKLPMNFNSPYKANSIIEFWRRWHMTLSRFMLDYLYIPLGGNRKGKFRHYVNLLIAMLLGGLWHGAGWTFVLWGGLQGVYLGINHAWERLREQLGINAASRLYLCGARMLTFLAIVWAWVLFRAETLQGAAEVYRGMIGMNGFVLDPSWIRKLGGAIQWTESVGVTFDTEIINQDRALTRSFGLLLIAWLLPNTVQWMQRFQPVLRMPEEWKLFVRFLWKPSTAWAIFILLGAVYTIFQMTTVSEFLYFQF